MSDFLVELETLVPNIAAAIGSRNLKNALGRAAEKLADLPRQAERLEALAKTAAALEATQNTNLNNSLREAADTADEIGRLLERANTPESLQDVSEELPELTMALRNLDNIIRQAWAATVQNEFQVLVSVGSLLARIAKTEDLGERLSAVGSEAQALVERKPRAEELTTGVLTLRERRTALVSELRLLTNNPEVDIFLNAVTHDTATLAHVTPAVISWLQENNALSAFSVRGSN